MLVDQTDRTTIGFAIVGGGGAGGGESSEDILRVYREKGLGGEGGRGVNFFRVCEG